MTSYLYMFKASGLQRYIFATQPLKEVIGASQLLIELTSTYLTRALARCAPSGGYQIIQEVAGSAIIEFDSREELETFYALWPLLVSQLAPGVELDQWAGPREEQENLFADLQRGWDALKERRNLAVPPLPETAPVARRAEGSGQAAVATNPTAKKGVVDFSSLRKLEIAKKHHGAAAGVSASDVNPRWERSNWATDLSQISRSQDSFLAVVHADGNRVGRFLIDLAQSIKASSLSADQIRAFYKQFSMGLARATKDALIIALRDLAPKGNRKGTSVLPARPVVVGGDDITLILPADLAISITETFLQTFEQNTEALLTSLRKEFPALTVLEEPQYRRFTACAGIVFQKEKYPLLQGYDYAEALCSDAKNEAIQEDNTTASALLFTRLLDSDVTDLHSRRDARYVDGNSGIRTCAGPYSTKSDKGLIPLASLRKVARDLREKKIARNSAREIIDYLHSDAVEAQKSLDRAIEVGGKETEHFSKGLHEIQEARTLQAEHLNALSILPDAAILEKMETLANTEAP